MPRRLAQPDLRDEHVVLEPLVRALAGELGWVVAGDPAIDRFTLLPTKPEPGFLVTWLGTYEDAWDNDAARIGFAIRGLDDGAMLGFAGFVHLDLDMRQGEIGYVVAPEARGRGAATRAVTLLTRWGFDELALERIELRIDTANHASERVAERAGYRLDGVLRNVYFKEGLRSDTGVWSRLSHD